VGAPNINGLKAIQDGKAGRQNGGLLDSQDNEIISC
jgi:hypothetical protein